MSARRSGRAKAPVKYTSDSEGSDFRAKKPKKSVSKKPGATPKEATKREAEAEATTAAAPTPKRRKKDPETLAAELREKAQQQEEKAQHKKAWEDWQNENDAAGKLLDTEPEREESITQTDSQKKYGLKPGELGSLPHFEKKNPSYGNTMKIFIEQDVRNLSFRKYALLAGVTDETAVLEKGEALWKAEHASSDDAITTSSPAKKPEPKPAKAKTPKQKWADYVASHSLSSTTFPLAEEPDQVVNQTDSKTKYALTPQDLACLAYFPKPNPKYGNTTKLFQESEVRTLAYRKHAILAGVEETDDEELVKRGEELWEEKE